MTLALATRVRGFVRSKIAALPLQSLVRNVTAAAFVGATLAAGAQTVQHLPGPVNVGTSTAPQTVTLNFLAPGTVSEVRVLTQGAANLDFASTGDSCNTGVSFSQGQTCTVNVTATPTAPGRRVGAVVLVDAAHHVLASTPIDVQANGPLAVIRSGQFLTVAGINTEWRYDARDEGTQATRAKIFLPLGVVADDSGVFYISDSNNNRIRKVDAGGFITTYAGNGNGGIVGDNGPATLASVNSPAALALDGAGNLYIADSGNNAIRRIDAASGVMTTVAGQLGVSGYSGDGFAATAALLANPNGIVLDGEGNLYIADTNNNAIRMVRASDGTISTIAGGPSATGGDGGAAIAASLNRPWSVALGPTGLLYIADLSNNAVRMIDANGKMQTVAGVKNETGGYDGDGGAATSAHLRGPASIAIDPAGNLYIADSANNRVRRVDAVSGMITTPAGTGLTNYTTGLIDADQGEFSGPYALNLDGHGNLYVADYFHNVVREVFAAVDYEKYPTMRVSKTSDPVVKTIDNAGNAPLVPAAPVFDQSALQAASTTCGTSKTSIASGDSCTLGVQFAPTQVSPDGGVTNGTLKFVSNSSNQPNVFNLYGTVLTVEPTKVELTSNLNPAGESAQVTFTAVVSETQGTAVPTGPVTFYDGNTAISGALNLSPNGIVTFSTSTLGLGSHNIIAKYAGDAANASSQAQVTQTVLQNTRLAVSSSTTHSPVLQDVTFTATLTANTTITSGTITFLDNGTSMGTGSLTANGTATFTTRWQTAGTHQITAKFDGNTTSLASTSPAYSYTVDKTATTTMVSANPSTAVLGTGVTLTATVASQGGPLPTGTVTFYVGATRLGQGTLDNNGVATLTTTDMPPGIGNVTATYVGDDSNTGSTSAGLPVTIEQLTTVTTLGSNLSPANAGSPLQLSASVSLASGQTAVGPLNGTVTFYDGATVIGAEPLTNGTAVLTTNALSVGSHPLTAKYSGNTNYNTSTSAVLNQTVQSSSTTTLLSLSAPTVVAGKPVTMTATVNNAGIKATGTVSFTDNGALLQTVTLNAQAVATLTLSTLPVGPHSIVATYNADANYNSSVSTAAPLQVNIGNTLLTLAATPTSQVAGSTVTLNVKLTTDGVLPSNPTVVVTENGNPLTTLTLNAQGAASFPTTGLSVGTHSIVASFAGDAGNAAAQSQTAMVTINAATTTTTLTSSKNPANFGDTVVLQAAVASPKSGLSGTVNFQEGGTSLGTAQLNASGIATLNLSNFTVGTHNIVATYSGDSTHATSASSNLSQLVVVTTTVSIQSNNNPSLGGTPVVFTAQVANTSANSGLTAAPTGTMIFRDGATVLATVGMGANGVATFTTTSLSVATHSIVATYSGDGFYAGNSSPALTQTVRNASSQVALSSNANPAAYRAPIGFTVTVTGNGGAPTGTVSVLDGGTPVAQGTLINGTVVISVNSLAPGIHQITAAYAGDNNNAPSGSAALSEQVQQTATVALASSSNPALTLQTVTLTATVHNETSSNATGTIRFQEGNTLLGTATLNGNVATLLVGPLAAGAHTLTATYSGDTANLQAASPAMQLQVNLRPTQSVVSTTSAPQGDNGVISLISVVKWDGPAVPTGVTTFRTPNSVIGTSRVDDGGVSVLNVQANTITGKVTASYSGDASYAASQSLPADIVTAKPTNFTLALTPGTANVATQKYVVGQLTIQSVSGFSDTMAVGCLGLPFAATCSFDHDTIELAPDGMATVKVTVDTGSPLTGGGQASAQVQRPTSTVLAVLPMGALLGLLLFGKRRRAVPVLMLLMLASLILPTVGCGTITQQSTPAGTYHIAVSAKGLKTGVTLSVPMDLTVTK